MSHTTDTLKALTVPKLKELLAASGLAQTGKKDELIARLLEAPSAPVVGEAAAVESDAPIPTPPPAPAPAPVPAPAPAPAPVQAVQSADEKKALASAEETKRLARLARFGASTTTSTVDSSAAALSARAEKFGIVGGAQEGIKGLEALDRALGSKVRKEKVVKEKVITPVVEAVIVDAELSKKIADEEERKKKRAARFGPADEPAAKEAKVIDVPVPATV